MDEQISNRTGQAQSQAACGVRTRVGATALLASALLLGGLSACTAKTTPPTGIKPASGASAKPTGERPAELKGSLEKTKIRFQKVEKYLTREKTTGDLLDPVQARTRKPDEYTFEPAQYEDLILSEGRLQYALWGYSDDDQPYVVEQEADKAEYDKLETALDDDKFWAKNRDNWAKNGPIYPFFYLLYTVENAGYEASFVPEMFGMDKSAPLLLGWLDSLAGRAKLGAGKSQIAFSMRVEQDSIFVAVSTLTPDGSDRLEKPMNLRSAQVDLGGGKKSEALLGPTANGFIFTQPKANGALQNVGVAIVGADGRGYSTSLPIRTMR